MSIALLATIIMSPVIAILIIVVALCASWIKSAQVREKAVKLESSILLDLLTTEKEGFRIKETSEVSTGVYLTTCRIFNEIGDVVSETTKRAAMENPPVSLIDRLEREARLDALKKVVAL